MKVTPLAASILGLFLLSIPACHHKDEERHEEHHKVVVTTPVAKDVVITQQYVGNIHSSRHIEIRALESGYLEEIPIKEGQVVKKGDVLFKILPTLYQAKLDAEIADAQLMQIKFDNTKNLFEKKVVAQPEVALAQAELNKTLAKVALARAELNFATLKAPFDGIIDQQMMQQGSLISEGDKLTTLSDNSVMWVYFNVPESRYLEYKTSKDSDNLIVELFLTNGTQFSQTGKIGAIEADFNPETGNIKFRADFPNPDRLLRHGQVGTVVLSHTDHGAIVIPQRATFETLAKKYVYVIEDAAEKPAAEHDEKHAAHSAEKPLALHTEKAPAPHGDQHAEKHDGKHGIAKQREIVIKNELEDIYLIKDGVGANDKIILEGVQQVRDGDTVQYEFTAPDEVLKQLKHHAE
jgi:membrane fusion protein (multidrug efflux system)